MNAARREIPLDVPVKLLPILQPRRFKVMHGGRGGAKSHTIAQVLLAMGHRRKLRILCGREIQKTLKDSSRQLLADYIERMGLSDFYDVQADIIIGRNGTTFTFTGLQSHTAHSIKSYEGVDIAWIEEAQAVSIESWNILIPTIRKPGSECWLSMNPDQEEDYAYDRFIKHVDPDAWVVQVNWRDNPWFGDIMETERRKLKALNDDLYQHVWEGKCRSLAGLLFKRKWFNWYDPGQLPTNLSLYLSSDYAVSEDGGDYTEHGVAGLDEPGNLWFTDWYSEQADPEAWIEGAVALLRRHDIKIWYEEKGVILRAVDSSIRKRLREKEVTIYRHPLASAGTKAERALGFAARASAGTVWMPKGKPWAERLVNQLCSFTGEDGRVDDGVDVCSLLARGLDSMTNARVPSAEKHAPIVPFSRQHIEWEERQAAEASDKRQYR